MASFQNLTAQELIILLILRNVCGYKNMSRQQLESIFTALSLPKPTHKRVPKPKSGTPTPALRHKNHTPAPKSKKPVPTTIGIDNEREKFEMAKNRQLAENTWYEWYDWLINHIPESEKVCKQCQGNKF